MPEGDGQVQPEGNGERQQCCGCACPRQALHSAGILTVLGKTMEGGGRNQQTDAHHYHSQREAIGNPGG